MFGTMLDRSSLAKFGEWRRWSLKVKLVMNFFHNNWYTQENKGVVLFKSPSNLGGNLRSVHFFR